MHLLTILATVSGAVALALGLGPNVAFAQQQSRPNIIFILADDLGYAELGCYGQTKIHTPHIDQLARDGLRFTQYYSGHPVCAPSRCALLTGLHSGHGFIRDNREIGTWFSFAGELPLPEGTRTLPQLLQQYGYATACIGKWGLGGVNTSGDPLRQGFDHFFGYNCQRHAHNYYPNYLIRDRRKILLTGNDGKSPTGKQYAPDLMVEEALGFIRQHEKQPFFLYFATTVPHLALQVPEDSLAEYRGKFDEKPYDGRQFYLPHATPRAAYAAMITRMDRDVGRLMRLLGELGLDDHTLVFFASDNGPTIGGGSDSAFFQSAGPLRGLKCQLYEGGIRVPLIARWRGRIPTGRTTCQVAAAWDLLPTIAAAASVTPTGPIDGISLLPTLLGKPGQAQHEYLYWESNDLEGGEQAVRLGDWKGVRTKIRNRPDAPLELYNLQEDISETRDLAKSHPDVALQILERMKRAHTPSREFPFKPLD